MGASERFFVGLIEKGMDFLRPAASVWSDGLGLLEGGWRKPRRGFRSIDGNYPFYITRNNGNLPLPFLW